MGWRRGEAPPRGVQGLVPVSAAGGRGGGVWGGAGDGDGRACGLMEAPGRAHTLSGTNETEAAFLSHRSSKELANTEKILKTGRERKGQGGLGEGGGLPI